MVRMNKPQIWTLFPKRRGDGQIKSYVPLIKKATDNRRKCPICQEQIRKGKKVILYLSWFRAWRMNLYPEFRYAHLECVLEYADTFPSAKDIAKAKRQALLRSV